MNFKYYDVKYLVILILVLSIIFQPLSEWFEALLQPYHQIAGITRFVDVFSTISLITASLAFINIWGWKWKMFKWLIDLPDLNGRYRGQLVSSFEINGTKVTRDCVLEIKQNASRIYICAYAGSFAAGETSSRSYTTSEQLIKESDGFFMLYYIFTNEPDTLATQLNNHDGTAKFRYYPDVKRLDGTYYNRRANVGTIKVQFESKQLLGRLIP